MKRITIKRDFSLDRAAVGLNINKFHSQLFVDFRRLAAKKALASARNLFSSFRRLISFSCSFVCCLSFCTSSVRLIAVSGVCMPAPPQIQPGIFGALIPAIKSVCVDAQLFRRLAETDLSSELYCLYFKFAVINFFLAIADVFTLTVILIVFLPKY